MDDTMDIDIDLDLDYPDPPGDTIEQTAPIPATLVTSDLSSADLVPSKIHIRGLDDFTTSDIRSFSEQHFPTTTPIIEWIDDTSANLCFETPEIASDALNHIATDPLGPDGNPLDLRAAKPSASKPEASIFIRLAVSTDRKRPRAHEASRFYMMVR